MSVYKTKGTFTFKVGDKEYEMDYTANLYFGFDVNTPDYVEVEPSFGEDMPEDLFEIHLDAMEKKALDEAYKIYQKEALSLYSKRD